MWLYIIILSFNFHAFVPIIIVVICDDVNKYHNRQMLQTDERTFSDTFSVKLALKWVTIRCPSFLFGINESTVREVVLTTLFSHNQFVPEPCKNIKINRNNV